MNKKITLTALLTTIFIISCSNFLTEVEPVTESSTIVTPSVATVTFSGDVASGETTALADISLTVTWSEDVTNFTVDDLQVTNSTLTSFSGSGSVYQISLENEIDSQVDILISYGAVDEGNDETLFSYQFEADALTLTISSDIGENVTESPVPLTFDFSHAVSGFDVDDIQISGGSLENFDGSDDSYTVDLILTDDGSYTISLAAGSVDSVVYSSVTNSLATLLIDYDGSRPQVSLSTSITDGQEAGYGSLTFAVEFSEEVENFSLDDFVVTNATLSSFSGAGDTYEVVLTPYEDGEVSLEVPSDVCEDSFGNGNDSDTFSFTFDSSGIGLSITTDSDTVTSDNPITMTLTFSEAVVDLDLDDFTLYNGSLQNLSGSDEIYTVEFVPLEEGFIAIYLDDGMVSNSDGNENTMARLSFIFDSVTPETPLFTLSEVTSGDSLGNNDYANEVVEISLSTDYSGDTGSTLTYEYTTDGSEWNTFSDPSYLAVEGTYGEINLRVTDEAGNSATGAALTSLTVDTSSPDSPIVTIDTDPVNASNNDAFGFTLTGGEEGNNFDYTIYDENGSELTGSGTFDSTESATLTGLDLGSMEEGTILLQATQTDMAGNSSGLGQDSTTMDTVIPEELSVTITSSLPLTSSNNDSFSFTVDNGEEDLLYNYSLSSDGGGATIESSGYFDSTGTFSVSDLDLSALQDGTLTLSVTQTDSVGNVSPEGEATGTIDVVAENSSTFILDVSVDNMDAYSFIVTGEEDSSFSYSITSSAGGDAVYGTGILDETGEDTVGPLDLSGLADGYLILILTITDASANQSTTVSVVEKSSVIPETGTADFSEESEAVDFDLSDHGTQTIPSGTVKYDTTDLIGTDYDDVIKFSDLDDGESFTITGGSGFNTVDLTNYPSYDVTVEAGASGEDTGTITIEISESESASITYSDFQRLEFSSNNFTGSPHALELDTSDSTEWAFSDTSFSVYNPSVGFKEGIIEFEGSLDLNYTLDTTFTPITDSTATYKNGLILFDYQDVDNYKYIRASALADQWIIGEAIDGTFTTLETLSETIDETASNPLSLYVTGDEGMTAELWSDGEMKASYTFDDVLNDGSFGLANSKAYTDFTIDMTPTNWAPYVKSYDECVSQSAEVDTVLDLIADAVDAEGETLSLISVSGGEGTLTDNGDGTVTYEIPGVSYYGIDEYTYVVSDGTNTTTGTIQFDVVP